MVPQETSRPSNEIFYVVEFCYTYFPLQEVAAYKYVTSRVILVRTKVLLGRDYAKLNFAHKSTVSGLRFFNKPEYLRLRTLRTCTHYFNILKNPSISARFEPSALR